MIEMKKIIVICSVVMFVCISVVIAETIFRDGLIHNIDYQIYEDVQVDPLTPNRHTTINLVGGGTIPYKLEGYCDSHLNIFGGSLLYLFAFDNTHAMIAGGSMSALVGDDTSYIYLIDGYTSQLFGYDNTTINISGGNIGDNLFVQDNAHIIINGFNFAVDGIPIDSNEIFSILGSSYSNEPFRRLTGILNNNDVLNVNLKIGNTASVNFIPEPSIAVLLFSGLFLLLRRRK